MRTARRSLQVYFQILPMYSILSNSIGHAATRLSSARSPPSPPHRRKKALGSGEVFADAELAYKHQTSLPGSVKHEVPKRIATAPSA